MQTAKSLLNAVTANTVGAAVDVSRFRNFTVNISATNSPNATVKVWGKDGLGIITALIDATAYTAAAAEPLVFSGDFSEIYAEVSSYVAGTFSVTLAMSKSHESN